MSETEIVKSITDFLSLLENQGKLYFSRVGSGAIKTDTGRYFKSGKPGCPDIVACIAGQYVGLEVKTDKGRQSDKQKEAQAKIEKVKGHYYIVRSIKDVAMVIATIRTIHEDKI